MEGYVRARPGDEPAVRLAMPGCLQRTQRAARQEIWRLGYGRELLAVPPDGPAVACRRLVDQACLAGDRLPALRALAQRGEDIRVVADVPGELVIVDRRRALVALRSGHEAGTVLLVRDSPLLTTLVAAYETWWHGAVPLSTMLGPGARTADDLRLVALLAAGLTDKAIARQFGLGLRTVQRQVRALLGRLGSRTRFQAGHQAGRLRLLDRPGPSRLADRV